MNDFVFIHIPGTGGLSLVEQIGYGRLPPQMMHAPAWAVAKTMGDAWNDVYTFSFVRDQLDRLVTLCARRHYWERPLQPKTFADWMATGHPHPVNVFEVDGQIHRLNPTASARAWFEDRPVQEVFCFEDRAQDLEVLAERLGKQIDPTMNVNPSNRLPLAVYREAVAGVM